MMNNKYKMIFIMSLIVGIIGRIMNPGWMLIVMCWYGIVPIHLILYYIAGKRTINRIDNNCGNDEKLLVLLCTTFLVFNLLAVDGGDDGSIYCFFGLIKDPSMIIQKISIGSGILNFILSIICIFRGKYK